MDNLDLEPAVLLLNEIENSTAGHPPENILLALIYEELKKLNRGKK